MPLKVLEKLPSLTAEERAQLRQNCLRAMQRSKDSLVVKEAKRVLDEMDMLEQRELSFLAKLPAERRIEYAFRRLPANDRERRAIRLLHEHQGNPMRIAAEWSELETSSWRHRLSTMYRDRRHLLATTGDPEPVPEAPEHGTDVLIDIDDDGQSIRLKPEAKTAFTRLGYVSPQAPLAGLPLPAAADPAGD